MPIPLILEPALRGEPRTWSDLAGKPAVFPSDIPSVSGLQSALDAKIPLSQRGAANGVATLDNSGKIPSGQLPADQGVEFANTFSQFPNPGVVGKLYATQDTKRIYIWDAGLGQYVMSPTTTDDIEEGSTNLWFTTARVLATVLAGFAVGSATAVTSADTVLQAFGKVQAQLDTAILASNVYYDPGWIGSLDSTKLTVGTGLPANIVTSSLTRVGTIDTGVWHGSAISDTYLQTISSGGKVANSATTATSANTINAIVTRDGSGNFSAGSITASFVGNLTGIASSAQAGGLLGTTMAANVINSSLQTLGTVSAGVWQGTAVADAYIGVLSAAGKVQNSATSGTATNVASTLVLRDSLGNFAANALTLDQISIGTSATVGGSAVVTLAASQVLTNKTLTTPVINGTPTGTGIATANTASTLVFRDGSGNFSANNITATLVGNASTASAVAVANVTGLLSGGKILSSLLPSIAITDTYVVASQAAMLALGGATPPAEHGDVAVRTDINKTYILAGTNPAVLSDWQELLTPTDSVLSVAGRTGNVTLISSDITDATSTNTASRLVLRDGSGNFAATTITAALSGNATTATALATARTINGTAFDGQSNITVTSNAQTLTGTFVNSSVVTASFNSLTPASGTLAVSGAQTVSSTLGVTSTISAGGTITSTASGGASFASNGAATGQRYILLGNSGGDAYFGMESSAGGTVITGATIYDAVVRAPSGISWSANNGASVQMRLSSAGVLSVTSPVITTAVLNGTVTGTSQATANTASTLVMRDASGNFSAGTISAAAFSGGTVAGSTATFTGTSSANGYNVTFSSPTGSLTASKLLTQMETNTIARTYLCGPDGATRGVWEIYGAFATSGASRIIRHEVAGVTVDVPLVAASTLNVSGATTLAGLSATTGAFSSTLAATNSATVTGSHSDTLTSGSYYYLRGDSGSLSGQGAILQVNAAYGLDVWNNTAGSWAKNYTFGPSTFAITPNTTVGGTLGVTGTLSTASLMDCASLRASGATTPSAGAGAELVYSGGVAIMLGYNRTSSAYLPVRIAGSTIAFSPSGVSDVAVVSSTGLAVTGALSATTTVTAGYGSFTTPSYIVGDTGYGLYVSGGNLYVKSASGGFTYFRKPDNTGDLVAVDHTVGRMIAAKLRITGIPTSSSGLSSGDVWSNGGVLTIV